LYPDFAKALCPPERLPQSVEAVFRLEEHDRLEADQIQPGLHQAGIGDQRWGDSPTNRPLCTFGQSSTSSQGKAVVIL